MFKSKPSIASIAATVLFFAANLFTLNAANTERIYLSGTGPDDAVAWDFFCTAGAKSGQWTTIPVPSCWETEGFGTFDYGILHRRADPEKVPLADEQGHYRFRFATPSNSEGNSYKLVFDGVMTDAEVRLNGESLGPTHQGSFYRFSFEITDHLSKDGENLLEVTVSKKSANKSVNAAERTGDFWTFGGIFRPVWLEVSPVQHISEALIKAESNGQFTAQVSFSPPVAAGSQLITTIRDSKKKVVSQSQRTAIPENATSLTVEIDVSSPKNWTAESPNLYTASFEYKTANASIHTKDTKFGFRTIEIRAEDGLYLNGKKIQIRGVNRHCFRPDTGRTLSPEQSYEDARLIKSMNMNAVRAAHYPPDEAFLEACDELGLYVLDELCGWHDAYDTPTGAKLIEAMIRRDHNHPSIIAWNNGNERGWNTENDDTFHLWDIQKRPVLHPLETFSGIDTKHYPDFNTLVERSQGPTLYMPTEFLHGQYEGGTAAGLHDYWRVLQNSPTAIGGFIWVLADEGVARPDRNGKIDTAGDLAPDGILGPYHERDGNFEAIRSLWSPLQLSSFDPNSGSIRVENRFDFTNADTCTLKWELAEFDQSSNSFKRVASETEQAPSLEPSGSALWTPKLPSGWQSANVLYVTASDKNGEDLFTWSWPLDTASTEPIQSKLKTDAVIQDRGRSLAISWEETKVEFDWLSGQLDSIWQNGKQIGPRNGPQFIAYKQVNSSAIELAATPKLDSITATREGKEIIVRTIYRDDAFNATWRIKPDQNELQLEYDFRLADEADIAGIRFDLTDSKKATKEWLGYGPHSVWRNRLDGGQYGLWPAVESEALLRYDYSTAPGFWQTWQWLKLSNSEDSFTVVNNSGVPFFGIGQPVVQVPSTAKVPDLGLSMLHVIPAIGTKFQAPDRLGPQSIPVKLKGKQHGSIIFKLNP